jgi:hypothetical protein
MRSTPPKKAIAVWQGVRSGSSNARSATERRDDFVALIDDLIIFVIINSVIHPKAECVIQK